LISKLYQNRCDCFVTVKGTAKERIVKMEEIFDPFAEEEKLTKLLREATNVDLREQVKFQLVKLYLQYGEFFKMNATPNPHLAEVNLKKALKYQADHPVVNYRFAHIQYRKGHFLEALTYFQRAIDGSISAALNDTQMKLARMFMANCGIFIVKEALAEMEENDEDDEITIDEKLIKKYKNEILVGSVQSLDKMFYQLVTEKENKIISEFAYQELVTDPNQMTVILGKNEDGYFIKHDGVIHEGLDSTSYLTLKCILTSRKFLTNQDLVYKIQAMDFHRQISEEGIRQVISRLSRRIPFLRIIMEEKRIESEHGGLRTGRRLHHEISYCVLHRADDIQYG
jgi:tetratricopeptide (TPR) repeat protein